MSKAVKDLKDLSPQEANRLIAEQVEKAYAAIKEAERIADATGQTFDFGLAYGMGGTYYPNAQNRKEDDWYPSEEGWRSSSQSC